MDIQGMTLVTGANRGLGEAFTRLLLEHGAAKVYGGARNPDAITVRGVIPVRLDVTSPADIAAAARTCGDVTLLINILSVLSWLTFPATALYCATKAAAWSLTNGLRVELQPQGTLVVGVHCGFLDTDMAAAVKGAKTAPEEIVVQTLDAIEHGRPEVLADETSRRVRAALSADLSALYPTLTLGGASTS
jgi:NAD(P)-dependent dehydrogenase (short-subunit alcohol dehydrogenase family)